MHFALARSHGQARIPPVRCSSTKGYPAIPGRLSGSRVVAKRPICASRPRSPRRPHRRRLRSRCQAKYRNRYGVMSFVVTRRTREIGIRVALGATSASAVRLVLCDAVAMIAAGMAIGLPCVAVLGKLVQSQLFGITATDPATVAAATLVLAAGALAAAFIPAWRASNVSPTDALRLD
jgi:hypothetical protein